MTESTVPQWKQDLLKEAEQKDRSNEFLLKLLNDKQEPLNRQAAVFAVPVIWWGVKSITSKWRRICFDNHSRYRNRNS